MCSAALSFAFVFGIIMTISPIRGSSEYAENEEYVRLKQELTKEPLPHLVKLGYRSKYGDIWGCAGGLIGPNEVVTTTSCATSRPFGGDLKIVQVQNRNFSITKINTLGEIAVILLEKSVDFVRPACLSSNSHITTAMSGGWGGLLFDNQLHAAINKEVSETKVTVFQMTDNLIKVRPVQGSPCVVDRGGPLQISSKTAGCDYDVIGVLKEWPNCGETGSFGTYIDLAIAIEKL
ncbi:hypothetical protein Trydic_g6969 [Trypoxylus dichotomus]